MVGCIVARVLLVDVCCTAATTAAPTADAAAAAGLAAGLTVVVVVVDVVAHFIYDYIRMRFARKRSCVMLNLLTLM